LLKPEAEKMYSVIFVTAANAEEAQKIADRLIQDRLAACVNIVDNIKSIFWWKGKPDAGREALLIIKSKKSRLAKIIKTVKRLHSYELPEIIALPIIAADKKYLRWIDESLR
jgi:periplasmic divalent cation tolerance protein